MKKNILKHIFSISFVLCMAISCLFASRSTKALEVEVTDKLYIAGAQIKTIGNAGLRFGGKMKDGFLDAYPNAVGLGMLVSYGEANTNELIVGATVNGKALANHYTSINELDEDDYVYFTIYNIPSEHYGTYMTARMYAKLDDDSYVYANESLTRNIADVARHIYNTTLEYDDSENLVKEIALKTRVKETDSKGMVEYYPEIGYNSGGATTYQNKTFELIRGEYNYSMALSSGAKIYGANKNVPINENGERVYADSVHPVGETILTKQLNNYKSDNSNIEINGCTVTATNGFILRDNQTNIELAYNVYRYAGNYGIKEENSTVEIVDQIHTNINIHDNYFESKSQNYSIDIYIQGQVNGINIDNNTFTNGFTSLNTSDYGIRISKASEGSVTNITNNQFNKHGSMILIDLYYGMSDTKARTITNIIDNKMSDSYSNVLGGHGIYVSYLADNSIVNIIHNQSFRTSSYMNAIMLSSTNRVSTATAVENVEINILYNLFYSEVGENETIPRTEVKTAMSRIGIGLSGSATSRINSFVNYFGSSNSTGTYYNNNKNTNASDMTFDLGKIGSSTGGSSLNNSLYKFDLAIDEYAKTNDENAISEFTSFLEVIDGILTFKGDSSNKYNDWYLKVAQYKNIAIAE